jgi:hypothetical protein
MPSRLEVAAELRLGEKRTRQTQDLVCLAQLEHFALQGLDALFFGSGRPWTLAGITLLLAYPATQRFRCAANLGCDGFDCSPLRTVLAASLTMRTTRSMTSGEYSDCFFMTPFNQTMAPLQSPDGSGFEV